MSQIKSESNVKRAILEYWNGNQRTIEADERTIAQWKSNPTIVEVVMVEV